MNGLTNQLNICSYNSHGHGAGRIEYIQQLYFSNDFVMIQEHWLMDSQLTLFNKKIKDITSHCISGMENTKLVHGRPYGGCGILWKSDITSEVTPIPIDCNRLCAVSVKIKSTKFLLCTVYTAC